MGKGLIFRRVWYCNIILCLTVICLQLIYDAKDGGGSLGLILLHPDKLPDDDKRKFLKIGAQIPPMK